MKPKPSKLPRGITGDEFGRQASWAARHPVLSRMLLLVVTACLVATLLVDWRPLAGTRGLVVGEPAPNDIRASNGLVVTDTVLTDEKRRQAREGVPDVFVYDVLIVRNVQERVEKAFSEIRGVLPAQRSPAPPPLDLVGDDDDSAARSEVPPAPPVVLTWDPALLEDAKRRFEEQLAVRLEPVHFTTLETMRFSEQLERDVISLVLDAMSAPVSQDDIRERGAIILIRVEGSTRSEEPTTDSATVGPLAEVRRAMVRRAGQDLSDRPPFVRDAVVHLAQQLSRANLRLDASEIAVREEQAAKLVQPVTTTYARGEVIIRSGDRVSDWTIQVLQQMNVEAIAYNPVRHWLSLSLLIGILLAFVERFGVHFISKFRARFNDLVAMSALLLLVTAMAALLHGLGTALSDVATTIPIDAYLYIVPVAVGGIVIRTLMNSETALLWSLSVAILCAAIAGGDALLWIYYLGSSFAAAGGVGQATERGRLIRAGFIASLANVGLILLIDLVRVTSFHADPVSAATITDSLFHILFGLCGGLLSGVLAVGLIPVFEALGFLTDSKLLELSSLNHPLIREMIVKAPGTYHHSMVVGSLAEAGAEAIHANSLLVRVGASFHDIGKTLKPQYFIENQLRGVNPHDHLAPSMSALIITNHVKEGIEVGRKHGLPERIIDMIPQHHGTSLVSFFYTRALEQVDTEKGQVDESIYRYPGPKPQTKEGGIMMIADGVEAATRSLTTHSEGTIRARVQAIVNRVVSDGQLEECPLTLKDLHIVSETFVRVLLGIHHQRIEYPNPPEADVERLRRVGGSGSSTASMGLELPSMTPNADEPHPLEIDPKPKRGASSNGGSDSTKKRNN